MEDCLEKTWQTYNEITTHITLDHVSGFGRNRIDCPDEECPNMGSQGLSGIVNFIDHLQRKHRFLGNAKWNILYQGDQNGRQLACRTCSRTFYERDEIRAHYAVDHIVHSKRICSHPDCDKQELRLESNAALVQHVAQKHSRTCSHNNCGKYFTTEYDYRNHILFDHRGEYP